MANEKKENFALNDNKQSYIIRTVHVNNNGQPNTLITVHREVKRNQKNIYMFFISFPSFQLPAFSKECHGAYLSFNIVM